MWWSLVRHITGQYVKVKIDDEYTDEQSKDKEHASLQPSKLKQDAEHARIIDSNPKLSNKLSWRRTGETKNISEIYTVTW